MPRAELSRAWAARGQGGPKRARGGEGEALKVLDFYDVLRENRETVKDEEDLWNLARAKQEAGDRRLMQFLLSRRDLPQLLERVAKAEGAPENARRVRVQCARLRNRAGANRASNAAERNSADGQPYALLLVRALFRPCYKSRHQTLRGLLRRVVVGRACASSWTTRAPTGWPEQVLWSCAEDQETGAGGTKCGRHL